jgi:hypothetical protein
MPGGGFARAVALVVALFCGALFVPLPVEIVAAASGALAVGALLYVLCQLGKNASS